MIKLVLGWDDALDIILDIFLSNGQKYLLLLLKCWILRLCNNCDWFRDISNLCFLRWWYSISFIIPLLWLRWYWIVYWVMFGRLLWFCIRIYCTLLFLNILVIGLCYCWNIFILMLWNNNFILCNFQIRFDFRSLSLILLMKRWWSYCLILLGYFISVWQLILIA